MSTEPLPETASFSRVYRNKAKAGILYPRSELTGLIPFVFTRDTRSAELSFADRFNHFAASPLCALSFSFEGEGHILASFDDFASPQACATAPKICFVGPHPEPLTSWNPGDVHFMMIGLYPDAFMALSGVDPGNYKQQYVPIEDLFSGTLLHAAQSVMAPGTDAGRFICFQDLVVPLWRAARPSGQGIATRVSDWTRLAIMRAAMSPTGKSIRQFERRLKDRTGFSKRELQLHARGEDAFAMALQSRLDDSLDLAGVASEAGYSDQSHMGRLTKRITGHSPERLMRLVETEEAYWSYRLVGAHLLDR